MKAKTAYISLGSNLGDRIDNCQNGIQRLIEEQICTVIKQSKWYLTQPVDFQDQDWFINGVIKVQTALEPPSLLTALKNIEAKAGRKPSGIRFGPRILDLDILLYDHTVFTSDHLIIPHPRMHDRCFVLKPICDIDPDLVHPILNVTMESLLSKLDTQQQQVIAYP